MKCEICLSLSEQEYLSIFAEEHVGKSIAPIVAKHLWFKINPTDEPQFICGKCWLALKEFNTFYNGIERVQATAFACLTTAAAITKTPEEFVEPVEPAYGTEFFEVKVEPSEVQDGTDNSGDQPLHSVFVKCEDSEEPDPTAPQSDAEVHQTNPTPSTIDSRLTEEDGTRSTWTRRRGKKTTSQCVSEDDVKSRKAAGQQQEDAELLNFYKRIVCEVCDNQRMMIGEPQIDYGTWRGLLKHTKTVHRHDKIYVQCPLCELKLRTKLTLIQHKDMHENPEKYRCELCAGVYQNMKEHMQNKHQERQFCCDVCGKKFPFKKRLTVHIKKMHVEKDIICDQCQKPFTKYTIEDHRKSVHTARFVCEHCPKTFNSRFRLRQHMEEHDESLRNSTAVPCAVCGQVMRDKYILSRHVKLMHTVQPTVSCGTCGKTFKCKRNLSVHMANVCLEPTRLYPCTICGRQFRRKNKLKEHMSTHTGKPLYMCSFCPETFRQDTHLYYHRKNAHHEKWLEMQQQRKEGVRFKLTELA
ncbi:zinc finger protein 567-like [Anopheles bellator]|uniref:zinc finger protein 567-like n=1 Tax=Anopheles bellator TaxID=139047 RepID=UPI0026483AC3|nr:zinc finger protein 567-like [Anopheles bellator]